MLWRADGEAAGFLLVFAKDAADVAEVVAARRKKLSPGAVFWVGLPPNKTSRRYSSDINRDILWKLMTPLGFRPARNVAIDEDWSALRFVRERESAEQ